MPTNRKRYMVNVPPDLEEAVKTRARALNRPVANYMEWLVACDLAGGRVEEAPAPYGATPEKIIGSAGGKDHGASDKGPAAELTTPPKPKAPRPRKGPK